MTREEALKVANEMRQWLKTDREKEALETLIPELQESEDERIRNEIIDHLVKEVGLYPGEDRKEHRWLRWLERQKEQKSLNISAASEWLREHVGTYMNSEYNEFHKCVEYDGSIDKERLINDFEEAMQKEQKPINESNMYEPTLDEAKKWNEAYEKGYSLGYENGRNEQKPWEWSEEETKVLDSIIDDYEAASKSFCGYDGKIGLLRAIRDGEYNLPKPAWSEEDKEWLSEVYFAIDHSMYSEDERQAMKNYIDSLRSKDKAVINTPERGEAPGKKFMVRCKTEKKDNLWFDKGDERPAYTIDNGFGGLTYLVYLRKDGRGNRIAYPDKEGFLGDFEIIDNQ